MPYKIQYKIDAPFNAMVTVKGGFQALIEGAFIVSIVLYLYIYIALLAVHTNQKRFQCERPREKRAVLRE